VTYSITALDKHHNVADFDSGESSINTWLQSSAHSSQIEYLAQTFVIVDGNNRVIGYYALCSAAIHRNELAKPLRKHGLPSMIPLILLARLGVDRKSQGKGVGAELLSDAFSRCLSVSANVAVHGVMVHALNDAVKAYYKQYGFLELPNLPSSMILPMKVIASAKKSHS
jgi:GNAT superfamily N-acetyltransferase